jgi:hypothetical protein
MVSSMNWAWLCDGVTMLTRGQGVPSDMMSGSCGLSTVHGQPVLLGDWSGQLTNRWAAHATTATPQSLASSEHAIFLKDLSRSWITQLIKWPFVGESPILQQHINVIKQRLLLIELYK